MSFLAWRKACEVGDQEARGKPCGDCGEVRQSVSVESEYRTMLVLFPLRNCAYGLKCGLGLAPKAAWRSCLF